MAVGVFTRNERVTFVEKSGSEIGDGTAWPILVTLDQVAELFFRVTDAWFVSGEFSNESSNYPSNDVGTIGIVPPDTLDPPLAYYSKTALTSGNMTVDRSYNASSSVPAWTAGYFGGAYTVDGTNYYDVLDERGILLPSDSGSPPFNNYPSSFICGFSHYITNDDSSAPSVYGVFSTEEDAAASYPAVYVAAFLKLTFSGEIAWVDVSGSGNPLDPANELYLGLEFSTAPGITPLTVGGAHWPHLHSNFAAMEDAVLPNVAATSEASVRLVIQLAGDPMVELSCPLYYYSQYTVGTSGTDFVIQAQEWFPYATNANPIGLVWESETGVEIPVGAGFADANDPNEALSIYEFF